MDEREAAAAYARYFPMIRSKCSRMVRDDAAAQDMAQETFTRLWAARRELTGEVAMVAWVYRTATRLAIDHYRRGQRITHEERDTPTEASPDRAFEARRVLAHLASRLDPKELEALVLTRVDGLTQIEAAKVLEVSDRTVRRLVDRAEAHLEVFLAEERAEA